MIAYVTGTYDILRESNLNKLDEAIQKGKERDNKIFAVGIYSEKYCEELGIDEPLKTLNERKAIMEEIIGVDFTFTVDSNIVEETKKNIEEAYLKYLEKQKEILKLENKAEQKEYKLAYVPGTYDLFHYGHLENILAASKIADKIVVGVKSDELVRQHKNREPHISAVERMEILRHFKCVDNVFQYYTRDAKIADSWIQKREGTPIDVIVMGEDLRSEGIYEDYTIIYTDRPPEIAAERSTTKYTKKLKNKPKKEPGQIYTGKIKGVFTYVPMEKNTIKTDDIKVSMGIKETDENDIGEK